MIHQYVSGVLINKNTEPAMSVYNYNPGADTERAVRLISLLGGTCIIPGFLAQFIEVQLGVGLNDLSESLCYSPTEAPAGSDVLPCCQWNHGHHVGRLSTDRMSGVLINSSWQ